MSDTPCERLGYPVGTLAIVTEGRKPHYDIDDTGIPNGSLVRIVVDECDQAPVVKLVLPAGEPDYLAGLPVEEIERRAQGNTAGWRVHEDVWNKIPGLYEWVDLSRMTPVGDNADE